MIWGVFIQTYNLGDKFYKSKQIIDIIPATGLQIKYDPSIPIIYTGFGLLMVTAFLSYLPYTQIWIYNQKKYVGWEHNKSRKNKFRN